MPVLTPSALQMPMNGWIYGITNADTHNIGITNADERIDTTALQMPMNEGLNPFP